MNWRLRKEVAGSGSHGDLNAHLIDTARFLVGDIAETVGLPGDLHQGTSAKKPRPSVWKPPPAKASKKSPWTTPPRSWPNSRAGKNVAEGAYGTFEATRLAPGHKNYNRWEINGTEGTIGFCFERMNELEYCDRRDPPTSRVQNDPLHATTRTRISARGGRPDMSSATSTPSSIPCYDFVNAVATDSDVHADFLDGAKCVAVLESVVAQRKPKPGRKWLRLSESELFSFEI